MSRNGSGTYSVPNTFVAGTTITASAHNGNWDDIEAEMTNSVAADGQTPMTAPLKLANGTEAAPAITFNTDPDTGFYRIGANNLGISANGAKVLDIATTGLAVTGTLSSTGALTVSGAFTVAGQGQAASGTVSLPAYAFTDDPDSGLYRIGANNLGLAVNGAKVLDVSTTGLNVVGTVSSNGTTLSPFAQGALMVNGTIEESHTGNAVTFAIKTLAGTDPSAADPVLFGFRSATAANGNYSVVQATAALSLTISSGSTMGFTSGEAGKLWLVMFNDGGTLRLAAINCRSGVNIYSLGGFGIASSTAEGGAGAADSAQVFYTGTAVTSKAYSVIGYASYESGLATAGSWAVSPTRMQLTGFGVKLPGDRVQKVRNQTGAVATGSTSMSIGDTVPQNTDGNEYMTQAITPTSAANILDIRSVFYGGNNAGNVPAVMALFQDTTAAAKASAFSPVNAVAHFLLTLEHSQLSGTASATTFKIRMGSSSGTNTFNGAAGGRLFGGSLASLLEIEELVA